MSLGWSLSTIILFVIKRDVCVHGKQIKFKEAALMIKEGCYQMLPNDMYERVIRTENILFYLQIHFKNMWAVMRDTVVQFLKNLQVRKLILLHILEHKRRDIFWGRISFSAVFTAWIIFSKILIKSHMTNGQQLVPRKEINKLDGWCSILQCQARWG
jgi:hypothetical protein